MFTEGRITPFDMVVGVAISLALHGLLFVFPSWGGADDRQASPQLEAGREAVALTFVTVRAPTPVPEQSETPEPEPPKEEPVIEKPPEPETSAPVVEEPEPRPDPPPVEQSEPEPIIEAPSPSVGEEAAPDAGVTVSRPLQSVYRPRYPRLSRRLGEEGSVEVLAEVRADGNVDKAAVEISSGYARLDRAALEATRRTAFSPAMKAGQPIDSQCRLTFIFRLEDAAP